MASASFGYIWNGHRNLTHRVYPLEASLILTPNKTADFERWLEGKYLFYSYEPHLIIDTRYSMIWSNQKILKNQSFQDVRLNLETAGNLLYTGYELLAADPGTGLFQMLGDECRPVVAVQPFGDTVDGDPATQGDENIAGFLGHGEPRAGDDAAVETDAFVMKGSVIGDGETWRGNPAQNVVDPATEGAVPQKPAKKKSVETMEPTYAT